MLSKEILNTNFDPDKHSDVLLDTSKCAVSLSNTKRLLTGCLHSVMRGVGFTNVFIFCMCSFACSGFGVCYPPILVGDGHLTANSSIAALFLADMSSNNFAFVGERASGRFYWSSPLAAKQSPKSSRVCKFQEVQMLSKSQNKCWKSDYHLALLTMLSALRHS